MQKNSKKTEESRANDDPQKGINNHEEVIKNSPAIDQNTFDEHEVPGYIYPQDQDKVPNTCLLVILIIVANIGFILYLIF